MGQQRRVLVSRRQLLTLGVGGVALGAAALAPGEDVRAVPLSGVRATVSYGSLAVRSGPSSGDAQVGTVNQGTVVSCTATAGTWFRISSPVSGWISSGGVTLSVGAPSVNITRGSLAAKAVCLSFDADAERGYTSSILETLANRRVKASFALTGIFAQLHPDLVRRMVKEGHHVFSHSNTHRSFTGLSTRAAPLTPAERLAELVATEQYVAAAAGVSTRPMFRPPYGDYDAGVLRDIAAVGYTQHLKWTIDTLGWNGLSRDQIINRVLTNYGNGYIYVLHLGTYSQDGPALPGIIDGLRARGYGFGTLPEILAGTASSGGGSASCAVSPAAGIVESTATVTCGGFSSGERVAIHWGRVGSSPIATVTASSSGAASASVTVPKGPMAKVTVTAVGATSKRQGAGSFSVSPSLQLSRATGPVGTSVTATLRGYAANSSIAITWRHASSTATVATIGTSYSGSASVSFVVPAAFLGAHAVDGVGGSPVGRAGSSFSVTSTLALSSESAAAGSAVRATLRGFGNGESVALSLRSGSGSTQPLGTVTVSSTGSGSASVTIPDDADIGSATVTAAGANSRATASRPIAVAPGVSPASEATATPEPTATSTPTETPIPAATPTDEATPTAEPTATPSPTPTVPASPLPTITLLAPPEIEATRAILRFAATDAATVTVDYGLGSDYGLIGPSAQEPDGTYRAVLEPLTQATPYHYRISASGPGGTTQTEDATVTAAAAAPESAPAAEPTATAVPG